MARGGSNNSLGVATVISPKADIYRAAKLLIYKHGAEAIIHAAMRADELLGAGDMDGYAVWKRTVSAVKVLVSEGPPEGARVH